MRHTQLSLFPASAEQPQGAYEGKESIHEFLTSFSGFGQQTLVTPYAQRPSIPVYTNEFWTAKQRAASSLHEISYRACFKPQLPRFFINQLTVAGERVYDPFMGRGTTLLEAALLGRIPIGCDINPLSKILLTPRLSPPTLSEVEATLAHIFQEKDEPILAAKRRDEWQELLAFYHPETIGQLSTLRSYLLEREAEGTLNRSEQWIRMVATNRLTGHSPGFFSGYTLPPNQAVSIASQQKINEKRNQTPPPRDVSAIILKKAKALLKKCTPEELAQLRDAPGQLFTASCDTTPEIAAGSISLVVTSPPFLDIVDYKKDNWLRCWFNGFQAEDIAIWQLRKPEQWMDAMQGVFQELHRILKPGGHIAFEVGEIKNGKVLMEDLVIPTAERVGLHTELVLINAQEFTKTANCWGVSNAQKGTNTNRIILLKKSS